MLRQYFFENGNMILQLVHYCYNNRILSLIHYFEANVCYSLSELDNLRSLVIEANRSSLLLEFDIG